MRYQFLGEDEQVFRVKHPDGSEFHIAKSAVGPEVHKRIKSLEPLNMAEGGIVPEIDDGGSSQMPEEKFIDPTADIKPDPNYDLMQQYRDFAKSNDINASPEDIERKAQDLLLQQKRAEVQSAQLNEIAAQKQEEQRLAQDIAYNKEAATLGLPLRDVAATQPTAQPILAGPSPASATAPLTQVAPVDSIATNFALKESGIKDIANAQSRAADAQAKAYDAHIKQIEAEQQQYAERRAKLDIEHAQLMDAVKNTDIDANRLWSNMSTGNKVLASVSVILGGLGAGLAGKPNENVALNVIDKAIAQDIESQKANLGKKTSLLSENFKRYGNLDQAHSATMLQYNAVLQATIQQLAAKSNSQQYQGQAKIMLGDLGLQAAALKKELAEGGTKEDRERTVIIGGKPVKALDADSAKEARKIVGANDAMMSNLDKLIALRQKYGAEAIPGPIKAEMQTIAVNLQLAVKEAKALGTLDRGAEKFMDKIISDPTSIGFVTDQYQALKATQQREIAQKLRPLGINIGETTQNAPEIKTVNGKKFMRGPNGEAIPVQ